MWTSSSPIRSTLERLIFSKFVVMLFTKCLIVSIEDPIDPEKSTSFKGQLISKWFFWVVDFLQKTNENKSTWGIIVVKSNSFVHFLEEIDDPPKPFRN